MLHVEIGNSSGRVGGCSSAWFIWIKVAQLNKRDSNSYFFFFFSNLFLRQPSISFDEEFSTFSLWHTRLDSLFAQPHLWHRFVWYWNCIMSCKEWKSLLLWDLKKVWDHKEWSSVNPNLVFLCTAWHTLLKIQNFFIECAPLESEGCATLFYLLFHVLFLKKASLCFRLCQIRYKA